MDRERYHIQVKGWIGERWARRFDDTALSFGHAPDGTPVTTLSAFLDQAALRGVLAQIWDLNLTLLSVHRQELPVPHTDVGQRTGASKGEKDG